MLRCLVGFSMGLAMALLMGAAAGDDIGALERRVKSLEAQLEQTKNLLSRTTSKLEAVEAKLAALEKKSGAAAVPSEPAPADPLKALPAEPPKPTAADPAPAAPQGSMADGLPPLADPVAATSAPEATADSLAAYLVEKEKRQVIVNLKTAGYAPVDGCPGLWVSPLEQVPQVRPGTRQVVDRATGQTLTAAADYSTTATAKFRYIGEDDVKNATFTLQILYRNTSGKTAGLSELAIQGDVLKKDKDYVVRQMTPLEEEYSVNFTVRITGRRQEKQGQANTPAAKPAAKPSGPPANKPADKPAAKVSDPLDLRTKETIPMVPGSLN